MKRTGTLALWHRIFYAAFNVGLDDKHIRMVADDGVALAAIQGLNQKLQARRTQRALREAELTELNQCLAAFGGKIILGQPPASPAKLSVH